MRSESAFTPSAALESPALMRDPISTAVVASRASRLCAGRRVAFGLVCWALTGCAPAATTTTVKAPDPLAQAPAARLPALVPEPARVAAAPPDLIARLESDAFNYFRFLNAPWSQRVCNAFAADLSSLPMVRVHGDAHVEQYALTRSARGLDDFDDSASGPSVIDLVRFMGSIDLAVRQRGWDASGARLFDEFLKGYRQGLADRDYLPPEPAIVRRVRASSTRETPAFLAGAEALMEPIPPEELPSVEASIARIDGLVRRVKPGLPDGYLRLKKVGWARLGIGSGLARKALARVEGPGPSPDDDVILEAKQLSDLRGVSCLSVAAAVDSFRVVTGARQLGRIEHIILAIVPKAPLGGRDLADWWVRSWDSDVRRNQAGRL